MALAASRAVLPERIVVTTGSSLFHTFDLEDRIGAATAHDTLKGMFFQRIVGIAERAGVRVESLSLAAPPGRTGYHVFFDYPVADYFRLVHAAARALFPREPISEAVRKTAVEDFARFADSKIGRVMMAFGGSARTTLARSGTMYAAVLKGKVQVTSQEIDEGVRVSFRNYPGMVESYPVGTVEGACKYFGTDYEIEVQVLSPRDADYVVRLAD